ncbi:hypothetical protein BDZ89DRAFT_1079406 [Hymenopellis radicata]|nr:hypothetical protein BDZ89DRAFT_1079406 [Hymenopellis radicata]
MPRLKYTPEAVPKVEPRISSFVPVRRPTPDPNDRLEEAPSVPPELSNCKLLFYGYRIDSDLCRELGFLNNLSVVFEIGDCLDELRIGDYSKMAKVPLGYDLEVYYFAWKPKGYPVSTVSGRGVPAEKMKELEARMNLEPACWIRFDEVLEEQRANRLERTT